MIGRCDKSIGQCGEVGVEMPAMLIVRKITVNTGNLCLRVASLLLFMVNTSTSASLTPEQLAAYDIDGYIVLENLLDDTDMAPPREAMMEKVDEIANDLFKTGLITDLHLDEPFPTRLARLFEGLTDADFLKWDRGWRDRKPGYFELMSNPKILDAVESLIGPEIFSNPVYNIRPKVPGVAAGAGALASRQIVLA
jgi:hypothetical protein